jgi:Zn-dependent metalloprotease
MLRRAALSAVLILVAAVLTALAPSAAPAASSRNASAVSGGSGAEPDAGFHRAERAAAMAEARLEAPAMAKSLGLSRAESLRVRSVERDADGTQHVRYDRTLNGLAVIGGDLVVHEKASGALDDVDYAASGPISPVRTDSPQVRAKAATAVAGHGQGLASGSVGGAELVVWAVSGQPRLVASTARVPPSSGSSMSTPSPATTSPGGASSSTPPRPAPASRSTAARSAS